MSMDLNTLDEIDQNLTDEDLFEMLASKHRFQDVGKILHIGIIDYLTCFTCIKKGELKVKSFTAEPKTISVQHPKFYGDRFLDFMTKNVLGDNI